MSMEGSATQALELTNIDYGAYFRKSSIVSRIYVEGYDTSLSGHDFVESMREHFSSCGEVMHVYIPGYVEGTYRRRNLSSFALIYLRGEGAEEKALSLSGSCSSGGDKLVVESYPFHAKHLDHKFAPTRDADNQQEHAFFVVGYHTAHPLDHVKAMLSEKLSECGRVVQISLWEIGGFVTRDALVVLEGIDAIEKLLQLSASDAEGWENLRFSGVVGPAKDGEGACNFMSLASSSSRPTSAMALAATAPEDPNLPKPWIGLVDMRTQYGYFWNTETNVTQYNLPEPDDPETNVTSNYNLRKRVRR
uniref:DEAD-box ATP-dependent RNA helicase 46 n=1 Tax=Noccaea caerulescens TaxID=107243 RepID=A0A1J3FLQ2_NOCCA